MERPFRKISRVRNLLGAIKWYLSDDCLLAAKRVMYTVEYRRFYLHDLESIVVWPSRTWMWRLIVPTAVFVVLGVAFSQWVNFMTGAIIGGIGLAWAVLELALGPTAKSRIRTTGASVDLPLVHRTRRARKVLTKIDAAVRATRAEVAQTAVAVKSPEPLKPSAQTAAEGPAAVPIADATPTNGS